MDVYIIPYLEMYNVQTNAHIYVYIDRGIVYA